MPSCLPAFGFSRGVANLRRAHDDLSHPRIDFRGLAADICFRIKARPTTSSPSTVGRPAAAYRCRGRTGYHTHDLDDDLDAFTPRITHPINSNRSSSSSARESLRPTGLPTRSWPTTWPRSPLPPHTYIVCVWAYKPHAHAPVDRLTEPGGGTRRARPAQAPSTTTHGRIICARTQIKPIHQIHARPTSDRHPKTHLCKLEREREKKSGLGWVV